MSIVLAAWTFVLALSLLPTVIAQEVKKGGKVLKLRDDRGMPLWAGPR